jgi:hypothetical protein
LHTNPLEPRHRWDYNITVDHKEIRCDDMGWIRLAQDRDCWQALVNAGMNIQVP